MNPKNSHPALHVVPQCIHIQLQERARRKPLPVIKHCEINLPIRPVPLDRLERRTDGFPATGICAGEGVGDAFLGEGRDRLVEGCRGAGEEGEAVGWGECFTVSWARGDEKRVRMWEGYGSRYSGACSGACL